MGLTKEQLAQRRTGITATDAAKILGLSPYGCGEDVRLDKMGAGRPFVEHDRVKWGNLLEGPIREDYAQRHGVIVASGDDIGTLRHPTKPWLMATPDGLVYAKSPLVTISTTQGLPPIHGWEGKTHTQWLSHLYGEPGSDQVPAWELIQCVVNIVVCSAYFGVQIDRWDLTVFLDGLPTDYTIHRDVELEEAVVSTCHNFWEVHVIGGEPVPPDGSESYGSILDSKFKPAKEGQIVEATLEQMAKVLQLKDARASRAQWETEEERLAQEIKLIIGTAEAEAISFKEEEDGKIRKVSYKRSSDSQRVDNKGIVEHLTERINALEPGETLALDESWLDAWAHGYTSISQGSLRFTVPRSWSTK